MKRISLLFIITAALALWGTDTQGQQPERDKTKTTHLQADSTHRKYDGGMMDSTTRGRHRKMSDSTHAKSPKRPMKRDTTKTPMTPDNTGTNKRDKDSENLTPMNQSGKSEDVTITRKIRTDIMEETGLSTNAHNVKIITINGRVTLRGPVKTDDEKERIGEIAKKYAQSGNVDNQLEVQSSAENK